MDVDELDRLRQIQKRFTDAAQDYHAKYGRWPDPPPGVSVTHPVVRDLLPPGYDPNHGVDRTARMRAITNADGSLAWADANLHPEGFTSPTDRHPVTLPPGQIIDRFGGPNGRFTSPAGIPYPDRALPPTNLDGEQYHQYEVIRPLPVWQGGIAAQMGEPGGGTQYYLPVSVEALIEAGYLREVDPHHVAPNSGADHDGATPDTSSADHDETARGPQTHPLGDNRPGFSLMAPNDRFYRDARGAAPLAGHYDVIAHGTPEDVRLDTRGGMRMSARLLADMIRHRDDYVPGTPVRLLSCNTGVETGRFARELAQALGSPVLAPAGYLYASRLGRLGVDAERRDVYSYEVKKLTGVFNRYRPDGTTEEVPRNEWEGEQ